MIATNDKDFSVEASCYFTIEQVAEKTGLTKRTLRYYEEMGLLPPTGRTEGNYRRYSEMDIQRLERIKNLRDLLGFSLADIREIMEVDDERVHLREIYRQEMEADARIAHLDHVDDLIRKQLQIIEQKITGLEQMRDSLQQQIERHNQTRKRLQDTSSS